MKPFYALTVIVLLTVTSCIAPTPNSLSNITPLPPTPSVSPSPQSTKDALPFVVAAGQINAWAVATDDANIYWTDCGTNPTASDGRVLKMSKLGGASIVLAAQQSCPTDLALDATNAYFLVSDKNSTRKIMRVSTSGGTPTMLIGGIDIRSIAVAANGELYWTTCDLSHNAGAVMKLNNPTAQPLVLASGNGCFFDVTVDASGIYWIDDRGIMRLSPSDKTAANLTPARFHPRSLISDANNLYWVADNYLMRLAKIGGEPTALIASANGIGTLTLDAANIYWSSNNALYRIAKTGGTKFQIADTNFVSHLAVDEASLYWTNNADKVTRVAKANGVAVRENNVDPQTLALAQEGLNGLAVDETSIYWATCRYEKEKYDRGGVFKTAKNGGDVIALAQNQTCPGNLALDEVNIYWVNQGPETTANDYQDGAILKAAKNGGAPITLATGQSGHASLAVDDANVYWTACGKNRGVMKMAKAGGAPALFIDEKECPVSMAVDKTSVYWISGASVKRADKVSAATQVLASSAGTTLAIDDAYVYWTRTEQISRSGMRSCADERGVVIKVSKNGGTPTPLASFAGTAPGKIALSDSAVYYGTDCTQGIARVAKNGGTSEMIAPNYVPAQIALDAMNLYWTVYLNGTIQSSPQKK